MYTHGREYKYRKLRKDLMRKYKKIGQTMVFSCRAQSFMHADQCYLMWPGLLYHFLSILLFDHHAPPYPCTLHMGLQSSAVSVPSLSRPSGSQPYQLLNSGWSSWKFDNSSAGVTQRFISCHCLHFCLARSVSQHFAYYSSFISCHPNPEILTQTSLLEHNPSLSLSISTAD